MGLKIVCDICGSNVFETAGDGLIDCNKCGTWVGHREKIPEQWERLFSVTFDQPAGELLYPRLQDVPRKKIPLHKDFVTQLIERGHVTSQFVVGDKVKVNVVERKTHEINQYTWAGNRPAEAGEPVVLGDNPGEVKPALNDIDRRPFKVFSPAGTIIRDASNNPIGVSDGRGRIRTRGFAEVAIDGKIPSYWHKDQEKDVCWGCGGEMTLAGCPECDDCGTSTKNDVVIPQNNEGRKTCFACGAPTTTRGAMGTFAGYCVCSECGK